MYKGHNQDYIRENKIVIADPFTPVLGDMVLDPKSLPGLHPAPGCKKPNGQK
jgi:hypothetical protein